MLNDRFTIPKTSNGSSFTLQPSPVSVIPEIRHQEDYPILAGWESLGFGSSPFAMTLWLRKPATSQKAIITNMD